MTRDVSGDHDGQRATNSAPLSKRARKGVLAFVLHLYRSDPKFRGFLDFAAIGGLVFAFLHPPSLPHLGSLGWSVSESSQEEVTTIPVLGQSQPKQPLPPKPTEIEFDLELFDSSTPEVRSQLLSAAKAFQENDYVKVLDQLNDADQADANVAMLRGMATMALPGVENFQSGYALLRSAAEQGQRQAKTFWGVFLVQGGAGVNRDIAQGRALLEEAALAGDADAARVLGRGYRNGEFGTIDNALAVKFLRKAVELGDPAAMLDLAAFATKGIGMEKDEAEADRLVHRAAEAGYVRAYAVLGLFYIVKYASGWMPDPSEAIKWLTRGADAGDPDALWYLGSLHSHHAKEPPWRDERKGAEYFKRCADMWYPKCLFAYGAAFHRGIGIQQDLVKAYAYYSLSMSINTPKVGKRLKELEESLSATEIAEARRLAETLRQQRRLSKQDQPDKAQSAGETQGTRRLSETLRPQSLRPQQGEPDENKHAAETNLPGSDDASPEAALARVLSPEEITLLRELPDMVLQERTEHLILRDWEGEFSAATEAIYNRAADRIDAREDLTETIELLLPLAESGDANAQHLLASAYINHEDTRFRSKAVYWITKSATQGHAEAGYILGFYHFFGIGMPSDPKRAIKWYETALANGSSYAAVALGRRYAEGGGVARDPAKAKEYFELAAEKGEVDAYTQLGVHHYLGTFGTKDVEAARQWLEKAAWGGDAHGQWTLALLHAQGNFGRVDNEKFLFWATRAAKQGHLKAMHALGEFYGTGADGQAARDIQTALHWTRSAAFRGHGKGLFRYAQLYEAGLGVRKNLLRAFFFYYMAARHWDTQAEVRMHKILASLSCAEFETALSAMKAWPEIWFVVTPKQYRSINFAGVSPCEKASTQSSSAE